MSGKFPKLSWLSWRGKNKDAKKSVNKSSSKPSVKSNELESGLWKNPVVGGGGGGGGGGSSRRVGRKGRNREIDKEHDSVVVPFDGVESSSDSESVGSDWSIGWSEPHAPGFLSEDEIDSGFGVLVRCYGHAVKTDVGKNSLGGGSHDLKVYEADSQKHIDRWLSTLHGGS